MRKANWPKYLRKSKHAFYDKDGKYIGKATKKGCRKGCFGYKV